MLAKVEQMRGVYFDWKHVGGSWSSSSKRQIGVLAQEVEAVFPEVVSWDGKAGYRAVDYGRLTAVLLEAVKELDAQNHRLLRRMEALETDRYHDKWSILRNQYPGGVLSGRGAVME